MYRARFRIFGVGVKFNIWGRGKIRTIFKDLFGAAHALELPLVFGSFPKPLSVIFLDANQVQFDRALASIRSYWTSFAYTGNPDRGQADDLRIWQQWYSSNDDVPRIMMRRY